MKNFFKSQIFVNAVIVLSLLVALTGAFYFGYEKGKNVSQNIVISGVSNMSAGAPSGVDFGLFWQTWKELKEKYVDNTKLNDQDLVYGAVQGLVGATKDPYTVFMPPADAKKFSEDISGAFSGIGAEIGVRNDQLVIIAPLKNTPAERAGLRPLDKILKINTTSTDGITVDAAVKLIRGPRGTKVTLTILRNGWDKPKESPIIRDTIQIPTLDWEIKNDNIAYFHLYNFYENAPLLVYQKVVKTIATNPPKGPRGIILDLRNNPGGYLEGAVNIAGWFLESGKLVVSEEFASGKKDEFKSYGSGVLKNAPTVILLNEGSASASEILAGALRDNRADVKIVGKKSFGKGTVQQIVDLQKGATLKITIAHWLTPKGVLIDKNGIAPDYEVEISDKDAEHGKDPQLDKAIETVKNLFSQ